MNKGGRTRGRIAGVWLAGFSSIFTIPALAQMRPLPPRPAAAEAPPPPVPPETGDIERALQGVQSARFLERDETTRGLISDERFSLPLIEDVLRERGPAISLEGRERLLSVARDRFNRSPRAAMGISFGGSNNPQVDLRDRVIVGQTYPEFDSHRVLEVGDIITHADGQELRGPDAQPRMQAIIVSHDPGEAIPLVVRRGPEKVRANVRLRAFTDLPNTTLDQARLTRAWRYRSRQCTPAPAEPVRVPVALEDWGEASGRQAQFAMTRVRRNRPDEDNRLPAVSGGGAPRTQFPLEPEELRVQQFVQGRQRFAWGVLIGDETRYSPMTFGDELREIAVARQRERSAARPEDTDALRRLALLDKLDNALRAELAERGESAPEFVHEPEPDPPR